MSKMFFESDVSAGRLRQSRLISVAVILSLAIVTAGNPLALASPAQAASQNEKIAKWKESLNKRGVGEKSRWEVRLLDGRKIKGYTGEIREDGITLVDWKTNFQIGFSEIKSLNYKSSLSTPAKIAIAAGVGAGLLVAIGLLLLALSEGT